MKRERGTYGRREKKEREREKQEWNRDSDRKAVIQGIHVHTRTLIVSSPSSISCTSIQSYMVTYYSSNCDRERIHFQQSMVIPRLRSITIHCNTIVYSHSLMYSKFPFRQTREWRCTDKHNEGDSCLLYCVYHFGMYRRPTMPCVSHLGVYLCQLWKAR